MPGAGEGPGLADRSFHPCWKERRSCFRVARSFEQQRSSDARACKGHRSLPCRRGEQTSVYLHEVCSQGGSEVLFASNTCGQVREQTLIPPPLALKPNPSPSVARVCGLATAQQDQVWGAPAQTSLGIGTVLSWDREDEGLRGTSQGHVSATPDFSVQRSTRNIHHPPLPQPTQRLANGGGWSLGEQQSGSLSLGRPKELMRL